MSSASAKQGGLPVPRHGRVGFLNLASGLVTRCVRERSRVGGACASDRSRNLTSRGGSQGGISTSAHCATALGCPDTLQGRPENYHPRVRPQTTTLLSDRDGVGSQRSRSKADLSRPPRPLDAFAEAGCQPKLALVGLYAPRSRRRAFSGATSILGPSASTARPRSAHSIPRSSETARRAWRDGQGRRAPGSAPDCIGPVRDLALGPAEQRRPLREHLHAHAPRRLI